MPVLLIYVFNDPSVRPHTAVIFAMCDICDINMLHLGSIWAPDSVPGGSQESPESAQEAPRAQKCDKNTTTHRKTYQKPRNRTDITGKNQAEQVDAAKKRQKKAQGEEEINKTVSKANKAKDTQQEARAQTEQQHSTTLSVSACHYRLEDLEANLGGFGCQVGGLGANLGGSWNQLGRSWGQVCGLGGNLKRFCRFCKKKKSTRKNLWF